MTYVIESDELMIGRFPHIIKLALIDLGSGRVAVGGARERAGVEAHAMRVCVVLEKLRFPRVTEGLALLQRVPVTKIGKMMTATARFPEAALGDQLPFVRRTFREMGW